MCQLIQSPLLNYELPLSFCQFIFVLTDLSFDCFSFFNFFLVLQLWSFQPLLESLNVLLNLFDFLFGFFQELFILFCFLLLHNDQVLYSFNLCVIIQDILFNIVDLLLDSLNFFLAFFGLADDLINFLLQELDLFFLLFDFPPQSPIFYENFLHFSFVLLNFPLILLHFSFFLLLFSL